MNHRPTFYAIIPAEVRYSDLKPNAKLLYGEITALSSKEGYCFATNRYFAELYNVTKNTISLWVSQLHKKGFISVTLIKKGEQITERRIGIIKNDVSTNTNKEDLITIKVINTISILNRKENFINDVKLLENDIDLIKNFVSYWCEENKSKTKMRFEMEKTWNLKSRMMRWKSRNWNNNKPANKFQNKMQTYANAEILLNKINNQ